MSEAEGRKLNLIERGRISDVLLAQLGERLAAEKQKALKKMTQDFRHGNRDAVNLASGLAAYCALEDFESQLEKEIRQGRSASQELYAPREHPADPAR